MNRQTKLPKADLLFGLLLLALLALLAHRLNRGNVLDDEAFYLTIPYQLAQGSAPVLHQWNPAQLFGFLLLPAMRLYLLLNPAREGIVLHFRVLWLVLHTLTALFLYVRLRGKNQLGAAAAALIYFCFLFMGFPCLGYNSMGVGLMLIAGLTMGLSAGRPGDAWLAGFAFAGAVLCCPTLLLGYLVYSLAVLLCALLSPTLRRDAALRPSTWLRFTAACGVLAALLFAAIARRGDLRLIGTVMPYLLSHETHLPVGPREWLRDFCHAFVHSNTWFWQLLLGSALLLAAILLDRGRRQRRGLYLLLAAGIAAVFALPYLLMYRSFNYLIFPLNILGFFAWLLCEKKENRLFCALFLPGLVYWACIDMASDLGFSSIAGASAVNMPCSVLCLAQLFRELEADGRAGPRRLRLANRVGSAAAAALVLVLFFSLAELTVRKNANSEPRWMDDTQILHGAEKGLWTHDDRAADYEAEYAALTPLREIPAGNVLYLARNSLRVLEDAKRCVSNNLWFSYTTTERAFGQLRAYWDLFPDRRPDEVYLPWVLIDRGYLEGFAPYPHSEEPVETGVILHMDWSAS